ncbi:MAG: response regulator [Deltaproteobacteria bacterium]|nr:MAG: response regulator [Deltaproteobacteria bacterium]
MSDGQEDLERLIDSLGDALVAVDRAGRVTRLSSRAQALSGMPAAEAQGKPLSEVVRIVAAEDRRTLDDLVARALRGEAVARSPGAHALLVAKGGAEHAVVDTAVPLRDESGAVSGALLVLRDTGPERAAEEERARLQAQLVFSERMASMGTLSGGLAHEINNPLASVLANLDLLRQELAKALPDTAHTRDLLEAVAEAHRGADRVAKIVRGLKVFSRGLDERRRPLDVAQVAEQVLHLLANELRHRARVVRDFQPAPLVEASEAHLGQVLVNLILNAAQSIPEGEADGNEVRVSVRPGRGGEVMLEVRDTGAGMPPEVLARVFDPFFTTRPVGSGSGLGLSICHGIVTSLGGRIEAESTPGRGSAFRVTLPTSTGEPAQASAPAPTGEARRGRILLVEDDALVARAVRRTLSREHEVVVVETGRAALEAIAGAKFDLVISDLMMPEMTGMDLHAELLRTHPEVAKGMVFFSGGAFTDAAREFLRRVPNPQIEKPFDPQQLRELIRRLLTT